MIRSREENSNDTDALTARPCGDPHASLRKFIRQDKTVLRRLASISF